MLYLKLRGSCYRSPYSVFHNNTRMTHTLLELTNVFLYILEKMPLPIAKFPFILYPSLPEASSSLLVHFCSWCHTIHSHKEDFARLDDPEEHLQVMKDVCKNLFLRNAKVDILIIRVGALMDDSIHVKVEIVEFWNLKTLKTMHQTQLSNYFWFYVTIAKEDMASGVVCQQIVGSSSQIVILLYVCI